eukprot:1159166-Pelagomonas_calceolata.AAC.10
MSGIEIYQKLVGVSRRGGGQKTGIILGGEACKYFEQWAVVLRLRMQYCRMARFVQRGMLHCHSLLQKSYFFLFASKLDQRILSEKDVHFISLPERSLDYLA